MPRRPPFEHDKKTLVVAVAMREQASAVVSRAVALRALAAELRARTAELHARTIALRLRAEKIWARLGTPMDGRLH